MTMLTASMIVGILLIVTLLVIKIRSEDLNFPSNLLLPDGTKPVAFTQTKDWYSVVTEENDILIYKNDGTLIKSIKVSGLD